MLYLASPYSSPDPIVRDQRARDAQRACVAFFHLDIPVFSPIAHWHEISWLFDLPTDIAAWRVQCLSILKRADELAVLMLPGWEESRGVGEERKVAHDYHIPAKLYRLRGETSVSFEGFLEA